MSLCMNQEKIFLEVYCDDFKDMWKQIFRDTYAHYLRKKHKCSKKASYEIFDKLLNELAIIKEIRV